jgi:hypothetical protein
VSVVQALRQPHESQTRQTKPPRSRLESCFVAIALLRCLALIERVAPVRYAPLLRAPFLNPLEVFDERLDPRLDRLL